MADNEGLLIVIEKDRLKVIMEGFEGYKEARKIYNETVPTFDEWATHWLLVGIKNEIETVKQILELDTMLNETKELLDAIADERRTGDHCNLCKDFGSDTNYCEILKKIVNGELGLCSQFDARQGA